MYKSVNIPNMTKLLYKYYLKAKFTLQEKLYTIVHIYIYVHMYIYIVNANESDDIYNVYDFPTECFKIWSSVTFPRCVRGCYEPCSKHTSDTAETSTSRKASANGSRAEGNPTCAASPEVPADASSEGR